jgi:hypothetical protein
MIGAAMTLGISVAAFAALRPPFSLAYSLVAGLLQGLTLRFCSRQRDLGLGGHCLSFLPGALASSILLTTLGLKLHLTAHGFSSVLGAFVAWLVVSWLGLIPLLVPAAWLGHEPSFQVDIMSRERAPTVHGVVLLAIALTFLLMGASLPRLVSAGHWLPDARPTTRDLSLVSLLLSSLSLALATARIGAKRWWFGRVRRDLVPGWRVVLGEEAACYLVPPQDGSPSGLPRWDALSDSPIEGVLVFAEQEGMTFRDPSSRAAVPVAFLGKEARNTTLSCRAWPLILALVFLLTAFGTWFLLNLFRLCFQ